jgi:transposase
MPRRATAIELVPDERRELERRVRARTGRQQDALRARIVLRAADGATNSAIAADLGVARHTARHWRDRFAADRLAGLRDRPHQPDPRQYGPDIQAKVVVLACQPPADLGWKGQTHWTIKDLARYIGEHPDLGLGRPSKSTVHLILQAHDLRLDRL